MCNILSKTAKANIKLTIAYDGTHFLGWQKTITGPSIEQSLENAITHILQQPVQLQAASRTDAGVHANGQVVNFFSDKELPHPEKLQIGLNSILPKDIAVLSVECVNNAFHPTLDCKGKEYHYHLCYGRTQLPQQRLYAWHYPHALNIELMKEAAKLIVGKRDFKVFCNAKKNETYDDHVRDLTKIEIVELESNCLRFEISGANFMYKMVRNIVGTLVYIGCGKISLSELPAILESADRTLAGITSPAHGLFLHRVEY